MTKKKKAVAIVLSAVAAVIVLTLLYDMIFPKLYVRAKYPDMTVTAIEKEKGSWSLFGISDPEMRYLYYKMYDQLYAAVQLQHIFARLFRRR